MALPVKINDIEHSETENRFILIGKSAKDNILIVVHLEETDTKIRIISARKATKHEQQIYEG